MYTVKSEWTDHNGEAQIRHLELRENSFGMTSVGCSARNIFQAEWMNITLATWHMTRLKRNASAIVTHTLIPQKA